MSERCGNCRFYQHVSVGGHGVGFGNCRRFPPTLPQGEHSAEIFSDTNEEFGCVTMGVFPSVGDSDWCGEYVRDKTALLVDRFFADRATSTLKMHGIHTLNELKLVPEWRLVETGLNPRDISKIAETIKAKAYLLDDTETDRGETS